MNDLVVVKVGGSLLAEPGAMAKVGEWLQATKQPGQSRLLIAGGGGPVEALRAIDAANPVVAEASHWAAIRMMDASTRLLPAWLPGVSVVDSLEIIRRGPPGDWAFPCYKWLQAVEPTRPGEQLSAGWQTTSDAVAGRLAACHGACLVLLKHTLHRTYEIIEDAAADGVVDPELPRQLAGPTKAELVGLISPGPACG